MDDFGAATVVHPAAVHPPVGAMLSQFTDLARWEPPEGADWPMQRASKRARPAYSSTSFSKSSSRLRHDGHSARQDQDLSTHLVEHKGLYPWPPSKLMTSIAGTGAVLSSMSSAFREQEMVTVGGQEEYTCEPAIMPAEPNLSLGGETGRAMPNMDLHSFSHYTTAFPLPPYPPALIQSFNPFATNSIENYSPPAPAYDFNFAMTWDGQHHQPIPPDGPDLQDQGHFNVLGPADERNSRLALSNAHLHQPSTYGHVCNHDLAHDPVSFYPGGIFGGPAPWDIAEYTLANSFEGFEQASDDVTPPAQFQGMSQSSPWFRSPQSSDFSPLNMSPMGSEWELVDTGRSVASSSSSSSAKSSRQNSQSSKEGKANKKGGKGGRTKPLKPAQRDQASNTRRTGACLRCSFQRNNCQPDPKDPNGGCLTCQKIFSNNSKKIINTLCCVRWKLVSVIMFRTGGLNFTSRPGWEGAAMKDLRPEDWADDRIVTIRMTLGYGERPIELRVRRFKPLPGVDQTSRLWKDSMGIQQETQIAPYALYDIQKTRSVLMDHITTNAYAAVQHYTTTDNDVHELVRDTYKAAWDHMCSVEYVTEDNINLREFMQQLFKLWFASRNTIGSAWIVGEPGTEETLWMKPDPRPDYVLPGKISTPRLVSQQFDAINYNTMLSPWRNNFLTTLWKLEHVKTDPNVFFTIFLATFILLHEVSKTSKDRYWHARMKQQQGNGGLRYDMETFMENLHEGANIVLWCWHYYKSKFEPFDSDWEVVSKPKKVAKKKKGPKQEETLKKDEKNLNGAETDKKAKEKPIKKEEMFTLLTREQRNLMRRLADISSRINRDDEVPDVPMTPTEIHGWNNLYFDPTRKSPLAWEKDLHFVAQMFVEDWTPRPTWNRSVDVGQRAHI